MEHALAGFVKNKQTKTRRTNIPEQITLQSIDTNICTIYSPTSNFRELLFILKSQEWYSSPFLFNKDFIILVWLEFSQALLPSQCKHLHNGFYFRSEIPEQCTNIGKLWLWHLNSFQYAKRLVMGTLSDIRGKGQKKEFVNAL